jgi:hypothetical protein
MSRTVARLELTRFRGRCWGERKKEVSNAANTSAIRAGIPAPHIELASRGARFQELAREFEPSANAIRKESGRPDSMKVCAGTG